MSWSTDFSKLPETGRVIVQCRAGGIYHSRISSLGEGALVRGLELVAWHPEPEPFVPPKPEQVTTDAACWNLYRKEIVAVIEERTREIVAWEQKHGGGK